MRLRIVLEPSEEGGYTVHVPAFLGCISEGESRDEAVENIREAIKLYFDSPEDEKSHPEGVLVDVISI